MIVIARQVEFTGQREYLFERDAVRFAAVVDGHPTWCVVSGKAITAGGLPCSSPMDLLQTFDARFGEIKTVARRKLEKAEPGEEVVIVQADFDHG